MAIKAAKR
jgi:hypothetical protein